MDKKKRREAERHLEEALQQYEGDPKELNFLTVAKAFEILVEYCWRELKRFIEDEGLEVLSPKGAIRQAAKIHLITEPEAWLDCIEARNNSVHDYFGISEKEFIGLAQKLLQLLKKSKLESY